VILDIALQTMGIFEGKDLSDQLLKDKGIRSILEKIAPSVNEKDWKTIISLSEQLFELVIGSELFKALAPRLLRRFAFRLTLRCVPIVGWTYTMAAFVVAVRANYHRFSFAH
jgi:hypothetical protein